MKFFIFILLICLNSQARTLQPIPSNDSTKNMSDLFIKSVYEEIFERVKFIKVEETIQDKPKSVNNGERGKLIIEQLKQKNRERIARMRGQDPSQVKSGKDIVANQKLENKNLLKKINEERKKQEDAYFDIPLKLRRSKTWQKNAKLELEKIKNKVIKDHKEWKKKYVKELQELAKKQKKFDGKIDDYKKVVSEVPLIMPVEKKELKRTIQNKITKEHFVLHESFTLKVKDQSVRPTCSAFAGVRALEILLSQNEIDWDLSEQFFYWSSKEECQTSPCNRKGSWVGHGLEYVRNQQGVPLEKDCPYIFFNKNNNETQVPLSKTCSNARVKVKDYQYLENLDQVIKHLNRGKPVIASIKLSPNFYSNKGLVLSSEKNKGSSMDQHGAGHAVLIVGHIKLPKVLNEGSVCFVTANSWGEGWGVNGHACLSEKWMLEHRKTNPFVVVDALEIL